MGPIARDVRDTVLYREAEVLFRHLLAPGSGKLGAAIDLVASPDGKHIAFSGSLPATLDAPVPWQVCMADVKTGALRVLTSGSGSAFSPRFSPDGSVLAFRSDVDCPGNFQVHFLQIETEGIVAARTVEGWVESLSYSPDGRRVLLAVAGHGAELAGTQGGRASRQWQADQFPPWLPSVDVGSEPYKRRSAWILDIASNSLRRVSSVELNIWEVCWCGNSAVVALVSAGASENDWYRANLVHIDIETGSVHRLYHSNDQLGCLSVSPSGRTLAFVEAVCSDRYLVAGNLRIFDLQNDQLLPMEIGNIDITFTQWRTDGRLLVAGLREMGTVVADVDLASRSVIERWSSDELYCANVFYPYAAAVPNTDDVVLAVSSHLRPIELIYVGKKVSSRIVGLGHHGTDTAMRGLRPVESYEWRAPDGKTIQGWLMRGAGTAPAPLVMDVHGGPIWRWSPFFLGRQVYHLMLAARGYSIFWPNPRGSTGRGKEFARAVVGDMGGADRQDLLSGLDSLVSEGIADPDRIGVAGVSYGGFMTAWLIAQDTRFAAAVSIAPVTNWISQHLTSNIPYWDSEFLTASYADPNSDYYARSPVMQAHRVKTPTLNICGALDLSTSPEQAREFHNALLRGGTPSALVTYPQEGHGIRALPAMIDCAARIVDWFTNYMPSGATYAGLE